MFLKSIDKEVTVVVLLTFLVFSAVPTKGNGAYIETLPEKEAMFGWCKLNRIKNKTKRLVKSIEEYKKGEKTVEEVTLQIASLKRTANKAFKKNYKVHKIMLLANSKIENFMQSLMNEKSEQMKNKCEMNFAKEEKIIDPYNLQNSYESINSFINKLQEYEDNDWSEQSLRSELRILNEMQKINFSKNVSSRGRGSQESKILFAYVSVFCGCLLVMIPTPITEAAGASLISGGLYVLCEDKWTDLDESNKNNQERSK